MRHDLRPFTRADLPMLSRWLQTSEVVRWWGEPQRQLALLTEDLVDPRMRQWIVEDHGLPFAYVQAYPTRAWPQPHLMHLPDGACAIDALIGEPAMLGRGHGRVFLRALAEMLIAEGIPVVAIDPSLDNTRARRAYIHAGFVERRVVETESGPVVLMLFSREQTTAGNI